MSYVDDLFDDMKHKIQSQALSPSLAPPRPAHADAHPAPCTFATTRNLRIGCMACYRRVIQHARRRICVCGLRQVKRNSADIASLKNDVFNLQSFVLQDNDAAGELPHTPNSPPPPAPPRTPPWPGPARALLNANLKAATPVQMWQGWVKSRCRCGARPPPLHRICSAPDQPLQPLAQRSA